MNRDDHRDVRDLHDDDRHDDDHENRDDHRGDDRHDGDHDHRDDDHRDGDHVIRDDHRDGFLHGDARCDVLPALPSPEQKYSPPPASRIEQPSVG